MKITHKNEGFSAVELLITLFIAVTFLIAASQLYLTILKDSNSAKLEFQIANIAYEYLQEARADAPNPCASSNPINNELINREGLPNMYLSVAYSCPYASLSISKVVVSIIYNESNQPIILSTLAY